MKQWIQPLATVEKFIANEYVAACWTVSCEVPYETDKGYDPIVGEDMNNLHQKQFCGAEDAFKVETDKQGNPIELIEVKAGSTGGKRSLGTVIYDENAYILYRQHGLFKVESTNIAASTIKIVKESKT